SLDMLDCRDGSRELHLRLAAEQISDCGPFTAVGHMDHVDAGHHVEQLAGYMGPCSDSPRPHVDPARVALGVGDELGNGAGRNRRVYNDYHWHADEACNGSHVADEIEIELVVERCIDCGPRTKQKQRITVSRCANRNLSADVGASTWPVVDN